jgi:DNA-binding winged helix-turn-helix (wHTH) protein/tetratricopeptide (TPR) repeat protein
MSEQYPDLWQFGEFRLDVRRKVLRHGAETVSMPLKELEVLSMLVRHRGELVTKDELLSEIWADSFVEESNLTRHIYLLRKTLKDLGAEGLIENVPRRGYRFTGDATTIEADEIVLERRTRTRTLIEFQEQRELPRTTKTRRLMAYVSVAILLVSMSAMAGYLYLAGNSPGHTVRSLAVLPFKTIGRDTNSVHMGAGLADILTTRLGSLKNLKIRPAVASTAFNELEAADAGRRLGVDAVLEGSVYYVNDHVRVTARLIDVNDSSIIWSGDFEKLERDELLLHSEIAQQIVPLIAINLSPHEREAIAKKYTGNADAYSLYLRGRQEWNKRSAPSMVEAQRLFRNAIEADPSFALAYVGLADTLLTSQPSGVEAWATISKALELDPTLGEAHASRGFYLMFFEWNWTESEAAFKRAVDLNPNYPTAHHWYATLLSIRGDLDGAKAQMAKALDLDPMSHNFLADLGQLYYFSGDYEQAETYCRKALEVYPDFTFAHEYLHYIYLKMGRYEQAIVELAKADEINGRFAHGVTGRPDRARRDSEVFHTSGLNGYLEHRYPGVPSEPHAFYHYAMKFALTGENERALDWLEKSTDARMFLSVFAKANPVFDNLRSEERYQNILRKMGLG